MQWGGRPGDYGQILESDSDVSDRIGLLAEADRPNHRLRRRARTVSVRNLLEAAENRLRQVSQLLEQVIAHPSALSEDRLRSVQLSLAATQANNRVHIAASHRERARGRTLRDAVFHEIVRPGVSGRTRWELRQAIAQFDQQR